MTLKSLAIKTGIATIALVSMGLAAAAPASAHTNNIYGFILDSTPQNVPAYQGFATIGKTDGITTPLATDVNFVDSIMLGIEVHGEKGTAVGKTDGGAWVAPWDHSTGELGTKSSLSIGGNTSFDFTGLDTLNDGTTVTIIAYEPSEFAVAIASVDATGNLIPLTDITAAIADYDFISLATDPTSGVTYVFLTQGDLSFYLPVTVATDTVGTVTNFTGTGFEDGEIGGADFDVDGTLYFAYDNFAAEGEPRVELSKLGSPLNWLEATRQFISVFPGNDDDYILAELALTVEHTALANTGSELPIFAIVLVGTVAVLAGGVTVVTARRRSGAVV